MPSRAKGNWLSYASGPWGSWDISTTQEGKSRVDAYIDSGDEALNKALFDELFAEAVQWQAKAGVPLKWNRLDDKRACRIETLHDPADLRDPAAREELKTWAVNAILGMYDALNDTLRKRARQIRDANQAHNDENPPRLEV